jgi:hypothetical protein
MNTRHRLRGKLIGKLIQMWQNKVNGTHQLLPMQAINKEPSQHGLEHGKAKESEVNAKPLFPGLDRTLVTC